jgi:hypothetical protein
MVVLTAQAKQRECVCVSLFDHIMPTLTSQQIRACGVSHHASHPGAFKAMLAESLSHMCVCVCVFANARPFSFLSFIL